MIRQQPAFTFAVIAALALGIGATTAVFSVFNAVLLRPFPYPEPGRLVYFQNSSPNGNGTGASPAKFVHWQQQEDVVQDVASHRPVTLNYTGGDTPEQLTSGNVSEAFFRLWGGKTALGRTFSPEEDRPGGQHVVVLTHNWWKRRMGADPNVIGKTIQLSGEAYVVIGVLEPSFDASEFLGEAQIFTPFQIDPNTTDQGNYFNVAGRLKPGVTLQQAQARLAQSADTYRAKYPNALPKPASFTVNLIGTVLLRNSKTLLTIMLAAVAGVLLIACANVANLMLVRATVRQREMAIRSAMGADRKRMFRQLITESLLLSTIGSALGLLLGLMAIRALLAINTAGLPRVGTGGAAVTLDWRLVVFTIVVSIGTGLLFGIMPALHAARPNLTDALREGSGSSGSGRSGRLRSALVLVEVALALTLVIGSALLIRTSLALRAVTPGFDATNVLTMRTSFTGSQYESTESVEQAVRTALERVRAIPGVELASASCCIPLESGFGLPLKIVGRPLDNGPFHGGAGWAPVSPGYFEVFKIGVKRGRTFNDRDNKAGTPVVIINESMAKQYWPNSDPLNDRLAIGRGGLREFAEEQDRQIIGVVADSRDNGLNQDPGPRMFVPQAQIPDLVNQLNMKIQPMVWVVRTKVPPLSISAQVQEALRQATGLPAADIRSMEQVVSRSTSREQFNSLLMSTFALAALALAAIGIYGVMAYSVQQRSKEIGIRLALGSDPSAVRTMVVLQGMRVALLGVIIGVAAAFGLSRYMDSMLFGVQARDPLVFVGVPLLLVVIALLAVWIPAARASRVDPLAALRSA